jgi:hypothetical protein
MARRKAPAKIEAYWNANPAATSGGCYSNNIEDQTCTDLVEDWAFVVVVVFGLLLLVLWVQGGSFCILNKNRSLYQRNR